MRYDIEQIWTNIIKNEGNEFKLIRGKRYTYTIKENTLIPSTTGFPLSKENFRKAIPFLPLENTKIIQNICYGPSYVFSILMDDRIIKWNYERM